MKRFVLAVLASLAGGVFTTGVHADAGTHRWFGNGLDWYQHPCGWNSFVNYGGRDTPDMRHNYYLTIQHPELCSKLFP